MRSRFGQFGRMELGAGRLELGAGRLGLGRWLLFLGLALAGPAPTPAWASSVIAVTVEQSVNRSELVFEGRVISSRTLSGKSGPKTCFDFEIIDVIKGVAPAGPLTLCFKGGTQNGMTLEVHDLVYPLVGERGIYFVESLSRRQVNPLYGWSQGHYLIKERESGEPSITSVGGADIVAVDSDAAVIGKGLSTGVAKGAQLRKGGDRGKPLSLSAFKSSLRGLIHAQPR